MAQELVPVGTPYNPDEPPEDLQWFDIPGAQGVRIAFAFLSGAAIIAASLYVLAPLLTVFPPLAGAVVAIGFLARHYIINTPGGTGILTVNIFQHIRRETPIRDARGQYNPEEVKRTDQIPRKNLRAYLQGLSLRFPWENIYKIITLDLEVKADLKDEYAAKDGPKVVALYSYQWRPSPMRLSTVAFVTPEVVNEGIRDVFSGFLSEKIAELDAVEARKKVRELRREVEELFKKQVHVLENTYGIVIERFVLRDIEYEPDFQKARTTRRSMAELRQSATELSEGVGGEGRISRKDAMDMALMVNGQPVSKKIFAIEGFDADSVGKMLVAAASAFRGPQAQGGNDARQS